MTFKNIFIIIFVVCCLFNSCSEEDDGGYSKLENKEHLIQYRLYSSKKDVPIILQSGIVITDYWETEFITKEWVAQFVARCDDASVLMMGEIYVDGKLKARSEASELMNVAYRIKGKGY